MLRDRVLLENSHHIIFPLLFARQLWTARHRERQACFRAFLNNNWVGFALFLGIAGETMLP